MHLMLILSYRRTQVPKHVYVMSDICLLNENMPPPAQIRLAPSPPLPSPSCGYAPFSRAGSVESIPPTEFSTEILGI